MYGFCGLGGLYDPDPDTGPAFNARLNDRRITVMGNEKTEPVCSTTVDTEGPSTTIIFTGFALITMVLDVWLFSLVGVESIIGLFGVHVGHGRAK